MRSSINRMSDAEAITRFENPSLEDFDTCRVSARREYGGGIFLNREAIIWLAGAVLADQTDEWAEGRRFLNLDILARC